MKSAEAAGYIDPQTGRFIKPGMPSQAPSESQTQKEQKHIGGGGGEPPIHPFIQGLLESLPKPGEEWSIEDQVIWLETAAHIFGLMYRRHGKIRIEAT